MMVHHYRNSNEQMNYFGRPNRASMPSHLSREGVRSFAVPNRASSPNHHDSEDERAGNPPRRRIALACSRCRKRKIKCSGDGGNGQSCQNCKNAGTGPGTCQFLRVNSTTTYFPPATHNVSWPYSSSDAIISTPAMARGSNVGHYPLPSGGMLPSSGATAGFHSNSAPFLRQTPLNNQPGIPYSPTHSRQPYSSNYGAGFGDDNFDQYTMSAPQYLLPVQDLQTSASGYSTPDGSRNWTPIPIDHRAPLGNPTFDHDPAIRCGPTTYSYMNSSGSSVSSVATDGSSNFPGMGSLATSLPLHATNSSRTLPTPNSKKSAMNNNKLVSQKSQNETLVSTSISSNGNCRYGLPWDQEHITAGENQAPTSSTSLSTVGAVDRTSSKPSASPRGAQETSSYASIPLASAPLTNNVPSLSEFLPVSLPESTTTADNNQLGPSNTTFSTGLSTDAFLSSQSSSSSLYGYSLGTSARNNSMSDSMAADGILTSGLPYTHLRQPQSQPVASFETSRRSSLETSRPTHRTSISSINNGHC